MIRRFLHKYFIPHEGNDYSPHSLQKAAVVGMMLMVMISFAVANLQALLWITSDWMVSTILPAVIVADTNKEREEASLTPLSRNDLLDVAAQMKADDMASKGYFAHYSPGGVSPWHWFNEASYKYVNAGENLAVHFTDSDKVVKAWMNSPTHRENIMNGSYREIGIGTATGMYQGYDTVFVVQLFGSQAAKTETVEVVSIAEPESLSFNQSTPAKDEPAPALAIIDTPASTSSPIVAGASEPVEATEVDEPVADITVTTSTAMFSQVEGDVDITEDGTVVYSSFTSTSTGGIPASIESTMNNTSNGGSTALFFSFVTQPHLVLQVMYTIIGVFVVVALVLSIVIEIRRQQPVQIVYGTGLLTAMFLLFYIHVSISSGVLII